VIRVVLPAHLKVLARVTSEVRIDVGRDATQRGVIDALEASFPALRGTIRDYATQRRRPLLRFYAAGEDLSHEPPDAPLPGDVISGEEPYLIVGSMAGG